MRFLRRTRLDHGNTVLRCRRAWLDLYERGRLTLEGLEEVAPGIARAVRARAALGR